jgi:F420-non-reducing hydrogenase iron-sulfur subunit
MSAFEPKIIGFLCQWCADAGADAAGRGRVVYPANLRAVRVLCSGRVDPEFVLKAFAAGADGVIIIGCPEGSCHYKRGNIETMKRMELLKTLLIPLGIEPDRLRLAWVGADDAAGFAGIVTEMTRATQDLGPLTV